MGQPYVGEIRMFAGNFAPVGWMFCEGQVLAISEYDTLFYLIGTTYGGNGSTTFALPDLRGRVPIHQGNGFIRGQWAGVETVPLLIQQVPAHAHACLASANTATTNHPQNAVLAAQAEPATKPYGTDASSISLDPMSISPIGGGAPHENLQPYLCVNFIISLFGIFPSTET